ncbi:hypothetical protein EV44_g3111 [Erysiphe necator]|uniref:Reverse transcriptase Ty1/copia-type domain-containing protein n=1 Tax=Uncinula necator TaxID=52586 RepID=A0A0B1P8M7_UNCNE|nr:hypothetical protein EV44_g3111 [Erysiphe necator]
MLLQMAVKAVNDSAGPDGLVPTLLVYGAFPKMSELDPPSPTIAQRATAIRKAMEEVNRLRANRQIKDALSTRNGPATASLHDLPLNSDVLVWREGNANKNGKWTGPFTLLSIQNETCSVQLPSGPTNFRSTVVKPYRKDDVPETFPPIDFPSQTTSHQSIPSSPTQNIPNSTPQRTGTPPPTMEPHRILRSSLKSRIRTNLSQIPIDVSNGNSDLTFIYDMQEPTLHASQLPHILTESFTESRRKEINGLLEKGVFKVVSISDIPLNSRIFNTRFVDKIKHPGTNKAFKKSRLVVQGYNDEGKFMILTQAPTIQRSSQRILLALASMLQGNGVNLYLRDISQAYVQSSTNLNRIIFVQPPLEVELPPNTVWQVLKPLYGLAEARNHWFSTYHRHHIEKLEMSPSTYDPCLLYSIKDCMGIVGMQTDDTLFLADKIFADKEQKELKIAKFLAKDREQLTINTPLKFNGGIATLLNNTIMLQQTQQAQNLHLIGTRDIDMPCAKGKTKKRATPKDQYIAQRARGAYIASICQPEASFDLSFAAQVVNPKEDDAKALNKRIQWQIENPKRGLKFVKLELNSLRIITFTDASFANNADMTSQIGYVIVLADSKNNANIIHWSSIKCKRVTRSVLASELYAMALGFDISAAIKATLSKILQKSIPLIICTDSKSLFDCLVKLGTTREKRLMIDIMSLRDSYERREITEIIWIEGNSNPADAMTKSKACRALKELIDTNKVNLKVMEWVDRKCFEP